jgi:dihydroorotate dehydrogenase electron transfer subunit
VGPEVFREASTGLPVLSNPNGGKGGKSGEWIRSIALEKVAEIRRAVGPDVPLLGMGGVSSAADALALRAAGADVIGLGSVLARLPRQDLIPLFVRALVDDALAGTTTARQMLRAERLMEYRPFRLAEVREVSPSLRVLTLEGRLEAKPSQYLFAFLPGVGEKPFSIAGTDPVRLVIRRRGRFTEALCALPAEHRLLLRGPYGAEAPPCSTAGAVIVAGGTGVAVAPLLASRLNSEGRDLRLFFGPSRTEELELPEVLQVAADCLAVPDSGRPARVLDELSRQLAPGQARELTFYVVGPEGFLHRAAKLLTRLGARASRIQLCLETPSLCGVGLCGSCECGGRLLCKEGTFLSLEYLRLHGAQPQAEHFEAARDVLRGIIGSP